MKRTIYFLGIISANLLLLGALFKALHWPGASILLAIAIFLFCFAFLPLSLRSNYVDQVEKGNKWLYYVTYIVFVVCLIGALFKIMHWPGAGVMLIIGIPLPFVLFLPVYLYHTRKAKALSILDNLAVMFGLTLIAIFSVLLTLNVTSTIIESSAVSSHNNEGLLKYYNLVSPKHRLNDVIAQKSDAICQYIDAIKMDIINASNKSVNENNKDYNPILLQNKSMPSLKFMYSNDEKGRVRAVVLHELLNEYVELILSSDESTPELKKLITILVIGKVDVTEAKEMQAYRWVEKEFRSDQLALVMDVLTTIQCNIRFVEMEINK